MLWSMYLFLFFCAILSFKHLLIICTISIVKFKIQACSVLGVPKIHVDTQKHALNVQKLVIKLVKFCCHDAWKSRNSIISSKFVLVSALVPILCYYSSKFNRSMYLHEVKTNPVTHILVSMSLYFIALVPIYFKWEKTKQNQKTVNWKWWKSS